MPPEPKKPLIVISYAHADEPEHPAEGEVKWLSFVVGYLRPALKQGAADLWIDRLMEGGADWEREIEAKLRACDVFLLLVSRHSLSSDYVVDKEIKIIRERQAEGEAVQFYPLVLTPTPKAGLDLVRDRNMRPSDGKPLSGYPLHERYQHMSDAADEIAEIAKALSRSRFERISSLSSSDSNTDLTSPLFAVGVGKSDSAVLFSYGIEDKPWVDAFEHSQVFLRLTKNVGGLRIIGCEAEKARHVDLYKLLENDLLGNVVIIAFVSSDYCTKVWTVAEWEKALTESQRRRLIFVPLMLDANASEWWKDLRNRGKLSHLTRDRTPSSRDRQYWSFFDIDDKRLDIRQRDVLVNGVIAQIAMQIQRDLESLPLNEGTNEFPAAVSGFDSPGLTAGRRHIASSLSSVPKTCRSIRTFPARRTIGARWTRAERAANGC